MVFNGCLLVSWMCGYNSFSHFFVGYLNFSPSPLHLFFWFLSFFPIINKSEVNILVILIFLCLFLIIFLGHRLRRWIIQIQIVKEFEQFKNLDVLLPTCFSQTVLIYLLNSDLWKYRFLVKLSPLNIAFCFMLAAASAVVFSPHEHWQKVVTLERVGFTIERATGEHGDENGEEDLFWTSLMTHFLGFHTYFQKIGQSQCCTLMTYLSTP